MKPLSLIALAVLLGACTSDLPEAPTADSSAPDLNEVDGDETRDTGADTSVPLPSEMFRTTRGLVAYYPFRDDELGKAREWSGFGSPRELTLESPAEVGPRGLELNGRAVTIPFEGELFERFEQTRAFTIETWVTLPAQQSGALVQLGSMELDARFSSSQERGLRFSGLAGSPDIDRVFMADLPTHVVVTFDSEVVRHYVDGVLVAAFIADPVALLAEATRLRIGESLDATVGLFALYDRALSPGEVMLHRFVGPRPVESEERDEPTEAAVAGVFGRGVASDSPVRERTIAAADPSGNDSSLTASADRHALNLLDIRHPPDSQFLQARLDVRTNAANAQGELFAWSLLRPWSSTVNWAEASEGMPWGRAGAAGASDRAADPLGSLELYPGGVYRVSFDITETFRGWHESPDTYFGTIWTCKECSVEIRNSDTLQRAARPSIGALYWSAPMGDGPAPAEPLPVDVNGSTFEIAWEHNDADIEVYADGLLRARASGQLVSLQLSEAAPSIQLVTIDRWGRTSAPVDAPLQ